MMRTHPLSKSQSDPKQKLTKVTFWQDNSMQCPLETLHSEKCEKTLIFAFDANSALSCENGFSPLILAHSDTYYMCTIKCHPFF